MHFQHADIEMFLLPADRDNLEDQQYGTYILDDNCYLGACDYGNSKQCRGYDSHSYLS